MNRLLLDLNEAQLAAVTTTQGPLLIIAGAGSGKTRVLTRRLAYLLSEQLAEPYQVLAVTFTNKAAGEMQERVAALMGGVLDQMHVSTFHSFCARFLRREAGALGYDSSFTIFDQSDSISLVKNCVKELGISDTQFPPKGQLRKISEAKSRLVGPESFADAASGYFESRTAEIYRLYQQRLRSCNGMDFDDLLFNAVTLLKGSEEIGERYRSRFKYLMVDEYQDTNHIQYLLLKHLLGDHQNICVVGDEDQSIYGWRGADIRNILEFEVDFPGAKMIKLEQNYRSTRVILDAATSVIGNNSQRKAKALWTDDEGGEPVTLFKVDGAEEEAHAVVDEIDKRRPETQLKDTVILYRTNAQSRPFEEQLRRLNIPYQIVGGLSFYQRKEIKDLIAYLKLLANPADDISLERIINYPKRGIGNITIAQIQTLARQKNVPEYEIVIQAESYPELAGKLKRIQPFAELLEKYRSQADTAPIDLLTQDLVTDLGLIEHLRGEDPVTAQARVDNIEAFIEGCAEYARTNADVHLANYLSEISLYTDLDAYREVDDKLTLMTLHGAKGLEFIAVYIVGLEEGLFPLQRTITEPMELEEERRLFYVGATRAHKKLYLSTADRRFRFGEVQSIPSRFIREIDESLLKVVDLRRDRHYVYDTATSGRARVSAVAPERTIPTGVHYEYEETEMLRIGRVVAHPTFGRGTITNAEGFGESLRLEIAFVGLGVKKIMARFAKLKIIG